MVMRNLFTLLMICTGCGIHGFDDTAPQDYHQMQVEYATMRAEEKAAQKAMAKNAWARREITRPLKAKIREQLRPTVEFLEQKIKEEEPTVTADKAAYGNVTVMDDYLPLRNNSEYVKWQQEMQNNPVYATENPIIIKSHIPSRSSVLEDRLSSLAYTERKLYQKQLALEKELQDLSFFTSRNHKRHLQNKLAYVRHQLEGIDVERELAPLYKAHMHIQAQDVRQKYLDKFTKDIEHPTDRFVNTSAFKRAQELSHNAPARYDYLHRNNPDEMINYWQAKIHYADQSGMPWLYENRDAELAQRIYHGSDKLFEDAMNASQYKHDPYYRELRREQWNDELQRLEKKKQKRNRENAPSTQKKNWYRQMLGL